MRVLVVEDDFDIAEAMREMLELEGFDVACAMHGRDALQKLRADRDGTCLILLDLRMPVMDGYAFREEQLGDRTLARIPVVVVTADARAAESSDTLRVEEILKKPVNPVRLIEIVRRYCAA